MNLSFGDGEVLLIDEQTAGALPQPFEQHWNTVIVLDTRGAQIRQYEARGLGYAVHCERMDTGTHTPITPETQGRFQSAFSRAYHLDPMDVRRAVRLALKLVTGSVNLTGSVV